MARDNALLTALETFVHEVVDLGPLEGRDDPLRTKLDVLERIVELLRIRSGWSTRRVRIHELLNAGIAVEEDLFGNLTLRVGRGDRRAMWNWPVVHDHKERELQVPLLIYMLYYHRAGTRIGDLLVEFANLIRDQLAPGDAESTETGVTRIMTTIRDAAATLRYWGLLTDSPKLKHRRWELSVFGILVAVRLYERGYRLELPRRWPDNTWPPPRGGGFLLAQPVREIVRELSDPTVVANTFMRICGPNCAVFDTFGPAIDAVLDYCEYLARLGDEKRPPIGVLRLRAEAMMKAVSDVVPPSALAEDLAKHFAIEELLG